MIFDFLRSLGSWVRNSAHEQDRTWKRKAEKFMKLLSCRSCLCPLEGSKVNATLRVGFYLLTTSMFWIKFKANVDLGLICSKKRRTCFKIPVLVCRRRNKKGRSALKTAARDRLSSTIAAKGSRINNCSHANKCCIIYHLHVAAAALVPSSVTSILTSWKASDT